MGLHLLTSSPVSLQMNVSPASLANLYEENFKQDMAALKVKRVVESSHHKGMP